MTEHNSQMIEHNSQINFQKLSIYAQKIIKKNKYLKNKNNIIVYVKENLTHDGYDQYGPESNLWDLYLYIKHVNNNDIIILNYHWEDWFYDSNMYKGYCKRPNQIINKNQLIYSELISKIQN
jgi:hypothetical protein